MRSISVFVLAIIVSSRVPAQSAFLHPLADTASLTSYDGYSPSACMAAVRRVGDVARRSDANRSNSWSQSFLENDTVLTVERHTATLCMAQQDLSKAKPHELTNLARLYWFMGDTAHMRQAIVRSLALDKTDSAKAVTYRQLLVRFLLSNQRYVSLVSSLIIPGLDSLASLNARIVRLEAHAAMAHAFASSNRPGAIDSTQTEIAAAMESFAKMPLIVQNVMVDTIGPLFQLGAAEATERGDTTLAKSLLNYARQSLSRIPDGADYVHRTEEIVRYFGMEAPPIHADFVYGAGKDAKPVGPWPRRGRWTLVSPMPYSSGMAGFYRHIRDLAGDTLDIVFVASTHGSWRPRGPLTPQEESTLMYDYMSRRWGIPGALLVETRLFHKAPDGRRMDEAVLTPSLYSGTGLLIDPQGTIRAMVQPPTLVRFDQLLTSLMNHGIHQGTNGAIGSER